MKKEKNRKNNRSDVTERKNDRNTEKRKKTEKWSISSNTGNDKEALVLKDMIKPITTNKTDQRCQERQ